MSRFYGDVHRELQDRFETRALADRLEVIARETVDDGDEAFITSRGMFFLSTIDPEGRPTVSYKGGSRGFVKVVNPALLAFPSYDGNGMFLSLGNLSHNPEVGLLFIDFEKPHRLRLQGRAHIDADDPLLALYPGAQHVVRIDVSRLWVNCSRYIHRHERIADSPYVPRAGVDPPFANWKRLDLIQDVLSAADRDKAEAAGILALEDYAALVARGEA